MHKPFTSISFLIVLAFALQACACERKGARQPEQKEISIAVQDTFTSSLRPNEKVGLGKTYTDTVTFVEFNDNGDYWLLFAEKGKDTVDLIYDSEYNFIKGDEIEINWKVDSIRYPGDPEFLNFRAYLISAKKVKPLSLTDKKVKFLWRETIYDEPLKTDVNTIVLNEAFIKNISDPEKAALAYAATFIGNECGWNGDANDDRGNLKCKILSALHLGYQCSNQHLDFLRFWFRNNEAILKELKDCPTTPDGATIQDTFDEINLEVKGNRITVYFKANGINLRAGKSWSWTEKQHFEFKENELFLIKKDVSPIVHSTFDVSGN